MSLHQAPLVLYPRTDGRTWTMPQPGAFPGADFTEQYARFSAVCFDARSLFGLRVRRIRFSPVGWARFKAMMRDYLFCCYPEYAGDASKLENWNFGTGAVEMREDGNVQPYEIEVEAS